MARCDSSSKYNLINISYEVRGADANLLRLFQLINFWKVFFIKLNCVCSFSLLVYKETNTFKLQMGASLDHSPLVESPNT